MFSPIRGNFRRVRRFKIRIKIKNKVLQFKKNCFVAPRA